MTPDAPTSWRAGSDQAGSNQARPDQARPDQARSDQARPDHTAPDRAASNQAWRGFHPLRWWRERRLDRVRIPQAGFDAALARIPILCGLTAGERARLRDRASLLIADKTFSAAGDGVVSDTLQWHIALQASLLTLKLDGNAWRGWNEIILYPDEFLRTQTTTDAAGVVHQSRDILAGEAWHGGPLVLSAADALDSGFGDGTNVVLHEFAHKLDMLNGDANGQPPLHRGMDARAWAADLGQAYYALCRQVDRGVEPVIDPYAATNPAEFFAVTSEAFFETPDVLADVYPKVYKHYRDFYRQDPLLRLATCTQPGEQHSVGQASA